MADKDSIELTKIYDPSETDEANSVRYLFSKENNFDINEGPAQEIDKNIIIGNIENCLKTGSDNNPNIFNEKVHLTTQQKNTFNEPYDSKL